MGQWPHTGISISKLKLPFNILPQGSHNYLKEAATVHEHPCYFLLELTKNQL